MTHQTSSFDVGLNYLRDCSAAAENPFYETAASPESLASLVRGHMVVRDAVSPISFPFAVEEVTGYYRRAG